VILGFSIRLQAILRIPYVLMHLSPLLSIQGEFPPEKALKPVVKQKLTQNDQTYTFPS
jgi:hypothetical protein